VCAAAAAAPVRATSGLAVAMMMAGVQARRMSTSALSSRPVLVLLLLATTAPHRGSASWPPHGGPTAAAELATRVLGPSANELFEFHLLHSGECDAERGPCATVGTGSRDGTVAIGGSTPVEMAYALAQYCQRELLMSFTWARSGGFQTAHLPRRLPPLSAPLRFQKRCAAGQGGACYTHYMNVVTGSYSAFNWGWARWEIECDWMALHGINLVVAFNGQEYLWREVWRELGLTDYEIQTSFDGPASLSWSRTYEAAWQNGGVFSPNGTFEYALDEGFLAGQHALQKQIVARQRALGIGSVLPAFSGKVPGQLKRLFPGANMSGVGAAGPAWIAGTDPLFSKISISFLRKAIRDWGRTGFYEADGYFVGGPAPWLSDHGQSLTHEAAIAQQQHGAPHLQSGVTGASHSTAWSNAPGGAGSSCAPAATIAEWEDHRTAAAAFDAVSVACEFGPIIPHHYIPGYASAGASKFDPLLTLCCVPYFIWVDIVIRRRDDVQVTGRGKGELHEGYSLRWCTLPVL
jgi:hypothetical protein